MPEIELLPCPNCGSKMANVINGFVTCCGCNFSCTDFVWNSLPRRTDESSYPAMLAEAVKQNAELQKAADEMEKALVENERVLKIDPVEFGGGSGYAHLICSALNISEMARTAYRALRGK